MDKALAIREVFGAQELISSAQVSRLSGLLAQLRIEDARAFLAVVAPAVSELLGHIEGCVGPVWEKEAREQSARPITHRAGDLLWRANAGWAVCLAEGAADGNMKVRLRGEEKKVKASFYANISDLAKRNHHLSELLADLRGWLRSP